MSNDPLRDLVNQSLGIGAAEVALPQPEPVQLPPELPPAPVDPNAVLEPEIAPAPVVAPAPVPVTPVEGIQQAVQQGNQATFDAAQAGDRQVGALETQKEAVAAQTANQQLIDEQTRRDEAELAERAAEAERTTQAKHQAATENLRAREEQIANTPIDSDRLWNSKSGPQKVAGLFAAFASGFMAPHQGGRNIFLEQFNRAIEQDLELQRQDRAAQLQAVGNERIDLDKQLELDRQQDILDLSTKKAMKQSALNKLLNIKTQVAGTAQEAVIDQQIGVVQRDIARDEQAQALKMQDQYSKQLAHEQKMALEQQKLAQKARKGGGGNKRFTPEQFAKGVRIMDINGNIVDTSKLNPTDPDYKRLLDQSVQGVTIEGPNGSINGFMTSTDNKKRIDKMIHSYDVVRQRAGRIKNLIAQGRAEHGADFNIAGFKNTDIAGQIASEWTSLALEMKNNKELGVLAGEDMALIRSTIGEDPTSVKNWMADKLDMRRTGAVLDNLIGGENEGLSNAILRMGLPGELDKSSFRVKFSPISVGADQKRRLAEAERVSKAKTGQAFRSDFAQTKVGKGATSAERKAAERAQLAQIKDLATAGQAGFGRGKTKNQAEAGDAMVAPEAAIKQLRAVSVDKGVSTAVRAEALASLKTIEKRIASSKKKPDSFSNLVGSAVGKKKKRFSLKDFKDKTLKKIEDDAK